jgi:hypothetical protein
MLEGKDNKVPYGFIDIAFFQVLGNYGNGARTGAASRTGDEQEGVRFKETLGGPDGIDNLIGVFLGYFGTEFVNFADAMAAGLATADENSVTMIIADTG